MKKIYAGVFLVAFATLLLEITLTRIYSVILFYNFAFMIISSALFGYGMSAVWLLISFKRIQDKDILPYCALLFSFSVMILLAGLSYLPISFSTYPIVTRIILSAIHYLILITPFFISGIFISYLFIQYPDNASRLYFFDLTAASLGSLAMLILISKIGAPGLLLVASLVSLFTCFLLSKQKVIKIVVAILIIAGIFSISRIERYFPIRPHLSKIGYYYDKQHDQIVYSRWSPVTKIDIAKGTPLWTIWIDGGTSSSHMPVTPPGKSVELSIKDITSIPYKILKRPAAFIIGPGGGWEVQVAKDLKASKIIAVEMDEAIVDIVKNKYKRELNNLFEDPSIELIANEGRSYLHSTKKKFDIIQQINNQTTIAIASGALNLSETFLLTREAFNLYLDHLTDNGIISIWKWGIERMFTSAIIILKEHGIQEPYRHIFIIKHKDFYQRLFLLKKNPFTREEINLIRQMCHENNWEILFNPGNPGQNPLYAQLLTPEKIYAVSSLTGLNLSPATDDRPFFNHLMAFWHTTVKKPDILPGQLIDMIKNVSKTERFTLGIIFIQSIIFSLLFLFMPLVKFTKAGVRRQSNYFVIVYFSCLGIGFIFLEIALMQKFVLFLGHPTYSISIILFSLLVSAGVGSYYSEFLINKLGLQRFLRTLFLALLVLIFLYILFLDMAIHTCIGSSLLTKAFITFFLILMLGILLGMPFPTGLSLIKQESITIVGWAWAVNAYMTVVGSMLAIAIALSFGFRIVISISFFCYAFAYIFIRKHKNH